MSKGLFSFIKAYLVMGYSRFDHIYLNRFYYHLHSNSFQRF